MSAVIFIHAGGAQSADPAWIEGLGQLERRIFSRREGPGREALGIGTGDLGALCAAIDARAPGQPLILVRAPLALDESSLFELEELLAATPAGEPRIIAPLSNAGPEFNPFAGLEHASDRMPDAAHQAALVRLLGRPRLHLHGSWPAHLAALTPAAVQALAEEPAGPAEAAERLRGLGGGIYLAERLYCADADAPLFREPRLEPHEIRQPAPWGGLRDRLGAWLTASADPEHAPVPGRPVNLHVSHSWGGGVATWVDSLVAAADDETHLQLLSEGPQSGRGAGQRLSLYLGRQLACPVDSWWLQPAIEAVDADNGQYRQVLEDIQLRFGVDRIIVSSLIGHSLDALRTGLPTVQVLHDHFPAWPLLSIHPSEYGGDLARALEDPRAREQFGGRDAAAWERLGERYLEAARDIAIAAPSRSVIDIQRGLGQGWEELDIEFIPHGLPPLSETGPVSPRPRDDGRLRLVIPGRVLSGKGAALLEAALEELTPLAQVYLLGTGKGGERFFGRAGVNVLLDYDREQLHEVLQAIGPHVAALLSIVPETFSYTLSEMKALGVPVIATRLGAFVERIEDGVDGWLIEPSKEALVEKVAELAADPGTLKAARRALADQAPPDLDGMLAAYRALCPTSAAAVPAPAEPLRDLTDAQAESWRDLLQRTRLQLGEARRIETRLARLVRRRTAWGLDEEQRRREVEQHRDEWVASLREELKEAEQQRDEWVESLREELKEVEQQRDEWVESLREELKEVEQQRDEWVASLQAEIDETRGQLDGEIERLQRLETELAARAKHILSQDERLEAAGRTLREQEQELLERARHITKLDEQIAALDADLQEQIQARAGVENELNALTLRHRELESERQRLQFDLEDLERSHEALRGAHDHLRDQYQQILDSHSWRITRPLRASRRVAGALRQARVWNPLRWPLLASKLARNLSTLGLRGTLERLQYFPARAQAPAKKPVAAPVEAPVAATGAEPRNDLRLPERMPCSEAPRVSVVIPVYNHLEHTAACLASIAETHCDTPFEVLTVDDASSDETAARLPQVEGLRYLRNERNLGFIHTCNRGAEQAHGEYLVFLNNDTQVQDGWLDRLLETFEARPDAGLVGARLVYPDGRLQECGGLVFRDGSGWNYGRGDDPERPEYQYLREVDYCSGACVAIRSELFQRLGGFDVHYAPAYYEDTDLAFKVREAGFRVYVQPAATVVHFEGVSSGTDIESGTKRYQAVNREKFLERWREALALQPEPIHDPEDAAAVRAARDHRLRGRVLVIDAYTPEPDQDSGSVRLTNLMDCLLGLGYGVTFYPDNRAWAGRYTEELQRRGVEAWYDPWLGSSQSFLERQGQDFAAVVVSRHYIAINHIDAVRRHAPRARFIFDTVDLHYLREQRLAELEDSSTLRQVAKQTRRSELSVIRDADATLVVSPVEREVLAKDSPGAEVFILSNIHHVRGAGPGFAERKDLYFVGGYQHPPNIDAVQWFCADIWPLVREQLPEARFHIVGSKAPEEIRELGATLRDQGVVFHGFVEALDPFLEGCRLSVAPLRYGAGVKGKVNQAMSHGQPVVATSVAVEGLHAEDGRDVLVADEAAAFADAVVCAYEDEALWNKLSVNGVENVRRHFSLAAARGHIEEMFRALEID